MIAGLRGILQMCSLFFIAFPGSYDLSQSKHSAAMMMGKGVKLQGREKSAGGATSSFSLSNYIPIFILALLTEPTFTKWNCLGGCTLSASHLKLQLWDIWVPDSGWCWANLIEILRFLLWGVKGFGHIYICPNASLSFTWEYLIIGHKHLWSPKEKRK